MQREERVTVQGPVKEQQPDAMSHRGSTRCVSVVSDVPSVRMCPVNEPSSGLSQGIPFVTAKGAYGNVTEELF